MNRKYRYSNISLNKDDFESLIAYKLDFEQFYGLEHLTWGEFMGQITLLSLAESPAHYLHKGLFVVHAERLNRADCKVRCPKCKTDNGPLKRLKAVAWLTKCSKCGLEFIAVS